MNYTQYKGVTVYLSGPMRGLPEFNHPEFNRIAARLRGLGMEVFNPAEKDTEQGIDVTGTTGDHSELAAQGFDLIAALKWDMDKVLDADAIVMMPGWEQSSGAKAEFALARASGKHVYLWVPMLGLPVPTFSRADLTWEKV